LTGEGDFLGDAGFLVGDDGFFVGEDDFLGDAGFFEPRVAAPSSR
jgi:hypothetical protein